MGGHLGKCQERKGSIGVKRIAGSSLVGLLVVTVLAVGLVAGCGSGKTTPTSTATSPSVTSPTASTSPSASSATLPRYQPSSLVSEATGSLQLTSTDSVQKVTAFYDSALAQGGWNIISSSKTAYSTNITARKANTGTTLSISTVGSGGAYISLTSYPM